MTVEEDYAIVRSMLKQFEADEWDVDDARHALARIWHVLRRAGLGSQEKLQQLVMSLEGQRATPDPDRRDAPRHGIIATDVQRPSNGSRIA